MIATCATLQNWEKRFFIFLHNFFFPEENVKLIFFPVFIIIIIIIIINSCPSHQGTMALTSFKCCRR
jgi:hypothetical protein